jgi:hypothetical protein
VKNGLCSRVQMVKRSHEDLWEWDLLHKMSLTQMCENQKCRGHEGDFCMEVLKSQTHWATRGHLKELFTERSGVHRLS